MGTSLKKVKSRFTSPKVSTCSFKIVASDVDEKKQIDKDKWKGLVTDISDDQQDITRGKGMVDSLFQAPSGAGTHDAIMSSYEYIRTGLRTYNFMIFPNIKVPLILGIWGGKGQGKSFQYELVSAKMGI
ncbi:hypothetical protein POM88_048561 [Heracleum sosnowskyi]|uniref:Uncharacterized protein n=1 Tax=Heracleum sosnowskyi TaxID=360622 RepID=A0AAD8LYL2_9APIA|nr:hypothetical protein POM88_048561 [Heracleum sosnowskyi]